MTDQDLSTIEARTKTWEVDGTALVAEVKKLRSAIQRIANLPLEHEEGKPDPELRSRRIAVAALGGNSQYIHLNK